MITLFFGLVMNGTCKSDSENLVGVIFGREEASSADGDKSGGVCDTVYLLVSVKLGRACVPRYLGNSREHSWQLYQRPWKSDTSFVERMPATGTFSRAEVGFFIDRSRGTRLQHWSVWWFRRVV